MRTSELQHIHVERYRRRGWDRFETNLLRVVLAMLSVVVVWQMWLAS